MEKLTDAKDFLHYRFQCECLTPSHCLDVLIEDEGKTITFDFSDQYNNHLGQRIKNAIRYIFKGEDLFLRDFILRSNDISELAKILEGKPNEQENSPS